MTKADIDAKKYSLFDVVLPLIGDKTLDPEHACATFFEKLLAERGLSRKDVNAVCERDFNASGDYRKILCRPIDVDFKIMKYADAQQPLFQTDLMALDGIGLDKESANDEANLVALTIAFTLPPSSYATMCLRELMKRSTSSEFQGSLDLGGAIADRND